MKIGLKTWNRSLNNRLAGTFFIFFLLTAVLVGWIAYGQATRSLTGSVFDRLGAVATLKEDGFKRWIDQQRLNIVFTAWQPALQQQAGYLLDGYKFCIRPPGCICSHLQLSEIRCDQRFGLHGAVYSGSKREGGAFNPAGT